MNRRKNQTTYTHHYTSKQLSAFQRAFLGLSIIVLLLAFIIFKFSALLGVAFLAISIFSFSISKEYKNLERKAETKEQEIENDISQVSDNIALPLGNEKIEQPTLNIPRQKDGCNLVYYYGSLSVEAINYECIYQSALKQEFELSAVKEGDKALLVCNGVKVGTLTDEKKNNMLCDWIRKREPFLIYINNVYPDEKKVEVFIAFYRDVEKGLQYLEKTVVKLISYSSNEKQINILGSHEGDILDLNDELDYVSVSLEDSRFSALGNLPKKFANRFSENGCAKCFFDHSDYDMEKDIYVPYVRIYWD